MSAGLQQPAPYTGQQSGDRLLHRKTATTSQASLVSSAEAEPVEEPPKRHEGRLQLDNEVKVAYVDKVCNCACCHSRVRTASLGRMSAPRRGTKVDGKLMRAVLHQQDAETLERVDSRLEWTVIAAIFAAAAALRFWRINHPAGVV